jgi:predicted RNA binding protein YcfA (HicA-like mRNA interferase family)
VPRKYPPLTPKEVQDILKELGFSIKNQNGSHQNWESNHNGKRCVVTVDVK